MMKTFVPTALLSAVLSFQVSASECGVITIADMNWNSASLMAHIDQLILNNGYQCDAELIPGDSVPTGTSMIEKGQPDVAPELWTNSVKEALDQGVKKNDCVMQENRLPRGEKKDFGYQNT